MRSALRNYIVVILALAAFSAFYFRGIKTVPFHPDESTQIFMSADFLQIFTDYGEMEWTAERSGELRIRYRLLDAPITRYLIGLGLAVANEQPLQVDWDWSKSWEQNRESGALPDDRVLLMARTVLASLGLLALIFFYASMKSILGRSVGLLATAFMASNSLFLLHTRRAMAEPALIFGVAFFLWTITRDRARAWLIGFALALAINAKQSALPLLMPALMAAALPAVNAQLRPAEKLLRVSWNIFQILGVLLLLTLALNPVYWRYPVQAGKEALALREDLLKHQVSDRERIAPGQVLDNPGERALGILANLYFTPPAFAEAGNYAEETRTSESDYLAIPGNTFGRNLAGGGLLFGFTLIGAVCAILYFRRLEPVRRRNLALLALCTLALSSGLLSLPLPWQRYVMPLLPFACAWAAAGLDWGLHQIRAYTTHNFRFPFASSLPKLLKRLV